jgi:hypothetical protein
VQPQKHKPSSDEGVKINKIELTLGTGYLNVMKIKKNTLILISRPEAKERYDTNGEVPPNSINCV